MSNSKKGALTLYVLAAALLGYSMMSREWRLRFAYHKDEKGAQYEQSERYSPKGMETFYGCKKGCQEEDKARTVKRTRTFARLAALSSEGLEARTRAGRDEGTLGLVNKQARTAATMALILQVIGWLATAVALGLFGFGLTRSKLPPLAYLGIAGGVGLLTAGFAQAFSAALEDFSRAFYLHATYNPGQVAAKVSFGYFAAMAGAVLLFIGGVLQLVDKGDPFAQFQMPDEPPPETEQEM